MPVSVVPVTNRKDLKQFVRLPWEIYRGNPNWVPPLLGVFGKIIDPDRNAFFEHAEMVLFLARANARPVGRIAAIVDRYHIERHGQNAAFFGFFECERDGECARALFDAARQWAKDRGMTIIQGPLSPSMHGECGLLIKGHDLPPAFMMPYNPPYYRQLIESLGFSKAADLLAYRCTQEQYPDSLGVLAERLARRAGFTVRKADFSDFEGEAEKIRTVYEQAWSENWGFVPMTRSEFNQMAHEVRPLLDRDLILVAESEGQTIGFSLTMPDFNQCIIKLNGRLYPFGILRLLWNKRRINAVRVMTMGVVSEFRRRGVDLVMYHETFKECMRKGYTWGEFSWILENNTQMRKVLEHLGAEVYKVYRIYESPVK